MAASAPMLLLLLAGFGFLACVEQASADSCMQRWIRLAGASSSQAVKDEKRLVYLRVDERNYKTSPGRHLLPFILGGGAKFANKLDSCIGKSLAVCKERPPCSPRGICLINKKSQRYACKCPKGLTGRYCERDINECRGGKTGCHVKARCVNTHGSYRCRCKAGYQGNGKACTDINECAAAPCQNGGKCSNLENRFACACPGGFSGLTCKEDFNECTSNPCQHGGQCIDQRNRFVCVCPVRYDGERCQHLWLQRNFFASMERRLGSKLDAQGRKLVAQGRKQAAQAQKLEQFRKAMESKFDAQGRKLDAQGRKQDAQGQKQDAQARKLDQFRTSVGSKLDAQGRKLDAQGRKLDRQGGKQDAHSRKQEQFRKSMDFVHGGCRNTNTFCERKIDGHGWSLVWKHSYLQVSRSDLAKAKTYSSFSKPCTNLNDGWCNVPNKQLPGAREQMIVAYHKGIVVYAYKSPLNPNLGKTEYGARLMRGWSRVVDKCTRLNRVRPDITRHGGNHIIFGIAFNKSSPGNINMNCDTVHSNYSDCRWFDCQLPKSISAHNAATQMTVAIFVR